MRINSKSSEFTELFTDSRRLLNRLLCLIITLKYILENTEALSNDRKNKTHVIKAGFNA